MNLGNVTRTPTITTTVIQEVAEQQENQAVVEEQDYLPSLVTRWRECPQTDGDRIAYDAAEQNYLDKSSKLVCRNWNITSWPPLGSHITTIEIIQSPELLKLLSKLPKHVINVEIFGVKLNEPLTLADSVTNLRTGGCHSKTLSITNPNNLTKLMVDYDSEFTTFANEFPSVTELGVHDCSAVGCIPINTKFPGLQVLRASSNDSLLSFNESPWCATHVNTLTPPASLKEINIFSAMVLDCSILFNDKGEFIDPENHGIKFLQQIAVIQDSRRYGAILKLGELHKKGVHLEKDDKVAAEKLSWTFNASTRGDPFASLSLGELYFRENDLVGKDLAQAKIYFTKAIEDAEKWPDDIRVKGSSSQRKDSIIQRAQSFLSTIAVMQIVPHSVLLLGNFGPHGVSSLG